MDHVPISTEWCCAYLQEEEEEEEEEEVTRDTEWETVAAGGTGDSRRGGQSDARRIATDRFRLFVFLLQHRKMYAAAAAAAEQFLICVVLCVLFFVQPRWGSYNKK